MKRALAVAALIGLVALPAAPVGIGVRGVLGVTPDVVVLIGVLWLLRLRASAPAPSWRSWALAVPWALLVLFECARAATKTATNEDLPLYDAVLLARHLYILARDLYGGLATAAVVAVALSPAVLVALGAALLGRVEAWLRELGPRRGLALVGLVAAAVGVGELLPGTRWVVVGMGRNARASLALYREVAGELAARRAPDVALVEKPDLLFYVIESYGGVCATAPDLAPEWGEAVDQLGAATAAAGWSVASGWSRAPVHGGRSWIADLSVLTGLRVAHQSTYEHVLTALDDLPTLPSFLAASGYETVLVKPADRVRPGVRAENPFRFARTVFSEDLAYQGPLLGWGRIPDQYTLEAVQERVLDRIEAPTFAFFHLATSHVPWIDAPPLLDDWRGWDEGVVKGPRQPLLEERSLSSELGMRMSRFRRHHDERERAQEDVERLRYVGTVTYDLAAIRRRLASGPRRPTLVVVMGDHQPPIVAQDTGFEVPVHLFASDPELLAPFLAAGFVPGPRPGDASVAHEDLFELVVQGLAR